MENEIMENVNEGNAVMVENTVTENIIEPVVPSITEVEEVKQPQKLKIAFSQTVSTHEVKEKVEESKEEEKKEKKVKKEKAKETTVKVDKSERFTTMCKKSVLEAARDIAFWEPGVSLSSLVEQGLRIIVEQYKEQHGGEYEKRTGQLKLGRRKIKQEEEE